MNFYIDFEATQPEQEIISIGIVAEDGDTFSSLMRPAHSKVTPFITELTGITQKMVDDAPSADQVFTNLYYWLQSKSVSFSDWRFYAYGNTDQTFIKCTAASFTSNAALLTAGLMLVNMNDYSKTAKDFFKGNVSLSIAFNYVRDQDTEQKHDALEDAKMLQIIADYISNHDPLTTYPFMRIGETLVPVSMEKMPSGTFYCTHIKQKNKHFEFASCDDAIDWFIRENVGSNGAESVHRDRIMRHIMKAIRTKKPYANYKWNRVKEVTNG